MAKAGPKRPKGARPRDAEASRAAILESARESFERASYDQVGLRAIAERAGVDPALAIRYFGSKEALFRAALSGEFDGAMLDRPDAARLLAEYVATPASSERAFDPLVAMLRSASNEAAAESLRSLLSEQFIAPLARSIGGRDARARAALVAATILGIKLLRNVVGEESLRTTPRLVPLVEHGLAAYLQPSPTSGPPEKKPTSR